jgi:hypothetical protein
MAMKKTFAWTFVLIIFLLLTACSKPAGEALTQTQGDYTASLSFDPDPPVMMTAVGMSLTLEDGAGQPVEGARVSYDLTMPAMTMPPNQPTATEASSGIYETEATFTMGGEWQADALVVVNGDTVHFTFDFTVE